MKNSSGFSLIELLVVIAIIGILITSFAMSSTHARTTARIAKATAEGKELLNAIRLYCIVNYDPVSGNNPMTNLGLNEGLNQTTGPVMRELTEPTQNNGNIVYFNAPSTMRSGSSFVDPWGNPYRVRIKKMSGRTQRAETYESAIFTHGHHPKIN